MFGSSKLALIVLVIGSSKKVLFQQQFLLIEPKYCCIHSLVWVVLKSRYYKNGVIRDVISYWSLEIQLVLQRLNDPLSQQSSSDKGDEIFFFTSGMICP
jgi:hypothetical protein